MSFAGGDLDMQPLSKVNPKAVANWGDPPMETRPALAAKVAQCIARWAENETLLGAFLALLLHANEQAVLAMYSGLENRSAQLRMIRAAAESSLPKDHAEVITTMLTVLVKPVMTERDKLAHWTWGYSDQLPVALLLAQPSRTMRMLMEALRTQRSKGHVDVPSPFDDIFVVRDGDLERIKKRGEELKYYMRVALGSVWQLNSPVQRAVNIQELSNVPQIRESLDRQKARQNNQAAQSQSPLPRLIDGG